MEKTRAGLSLIIIFNLFSIAVVFGQGDTSNTIGRVSIASPTAASLGKFGDIPVNYHTGIPQINIPIYTIEAGSLKLPVSLSYHASGLKVQENAGWVGAGWALNAGGVITRTVMGSPDDKGNSSVTNVTNGHYSDFGYNSYLNGGVNNTGSPDDVAFSRGTKDGEPDLYFFNFGNYSGKFYFNDDRTPILVPEADFKIQTYFQNGSGFSGFVITTPDGIKYYFGKTGNNSGPDPIEITIPSTLQNGTGNAASAASSWFLNKIVSSDGLDSITLKYQTENYSYYTLSLFPVLKSNYYPATGNPQKTGMDLAKNFVSGVRLSQISFPNGVINFTPSATPRLDLSGGTNVTTAFTDVSNTNSYSLGSISITNNNGFCKKDSFYYGYFFDGSSLTSNFFQFFSGYNLHTDEYRLRLDSLTEISCDGSIKVPPYKFNYFTEIVPRKLTFGMDHWGFSNGVSSNTGLVPTFTEITSGVGTVFQGANRDGAWPAMRGGALQQLIYPTGGSTSFDFEPKKIDTFYTASLMAVPLSLFAVHYYGQSQLTQTINFTLTGSGAYYVSINNYSSNFAPTLTILNSSGVNVAGSPILINFLSTYENSVVLPAGNYTATLAYPSYAGGTIINGAAGTIGQWQNVVLPNIQYVGGLRIKTIGNSDGVTTNNTSYSYTSGSQSSGVLYSIPTYVQILRNDFLQLVWPFCSANGCSSCDGFGGHDYYVSASSVRPMASFQGENVGYNEVDVSQAGNGRSVYQYYGSNLWNSNIPDVCTRIVNQSSICDGTIPNFPFPPTPFEFMRDELSHEAHYNQIGQILKKTDYYPTYVPDRLTTPGHISVDLPGLNSYTEYNLQSAKKVSDETLETDFDVLTGAPIYKHAIVYFGSSYHNQPTRKVSATSSGDSLINNIKYAMDFRIASCDVIPDSLAYYLNLIYSDSLAMLTAINTCTPQVNNFNNCRWLSFINYREQLVQARTNFIRYRRKFYAIDTINVQSQCYLNAIVNADTLLKPILRLQNLYQNPAIEQTNWKNQNLIHASFIRYDTSVSPVGFAYPGRMKLINLQAASPSFTNSTISGNTIAKDSRFIDEAFFKFGKGRPLQVLGKDGVPNSYIWDYQNSLPVAKTSNAGLADVAFTSFESDGKGNWNFNGSTSLDPLAITGTKDYSLPNGMITASGIDPTKSHIVSYWSRTTSALVNAATTTSLLSRSGWYYFEHTIPTGTSTISITGSVVIDELRLYPSDAQMTSYTYSPLVGMTSSSSAAAYINYYEYDPLGRLLRIRDMDKNIVKQYDYQYGVRTYTYNNAKLPVSFTRSNCSSGYVGSAVIYTVPEGTYGSNVSQAAADLQATNDVNAHGQHYADSLGTCTLSTATITASNPSHISGYSVKYTNTSTSVQTTFSIPTAGGTLGTLPAGTYNIHIAKTGGVIGLEFTINCNSLDIIGTSADFSNVVITASSCNGITIDFL